jgi:hypothetical protein
VLQLRIELSLLVTAPSAPIASVHQRSAEEVRRTMTHRYAVLATGQVLSIHLAVK